MLEGRSLSGSVGTVLDAVFALRYRVKVPAGGTVRLAFWTCVAGSRAQVLELADKHRDTNAHTRAATLAWTQAQVQLRHLGIDASQANLFQQFAGRILFADAAARSAGDAIRRGAAGPQALWSQGISGDLPIVLMRVEENDDLPVARQLLQAHEYWGIKRLSVDLVFLNDRGASYIQDLHTALESMVRTAQARPRIAGADSRGKVFVLRSDLVTAETRALLLAVARVVLSGRRGSLADQLERMQPTPTAAPRASRRAASALAAARRRGRGRARAGILQRARRLRGPGPRVRGRGHRRPDHAGTVDQRDRQPRLRFPRVHRWRRLHLGAQQPRQRADPVEQRSGQRPPGRGYLPARRRERRIVEPHAGAHPPRAGALLLRAWPGVQPLPAAFPWCRAGADAHGRGRRSGQDLPAGGTQRIAARAQSFGERVCRVGAGARAHAERAAHHHRPRRGKRRVAGAQSLESRLSRRRLPGSRRPPVRMDLRSPRIPRPARHAGCARRR